MDVQDRLCISHFSPDLVAQKYIYIFKIVSQICKEVLKIKRNTYGQHTETFSTSLAIGDIAISTTMKYHFTST